MSNVMLSLDVINDSSINSGQKILFRTSDYHDLVMLYDDGSDVAVWTKAEEDLTAFLMNNGIQQIANALNFGWEHYFLSESH